ncbi:5-methylcytosine-specific restriction protein A [Rhizobium sp. SG_E_25_P2]|uniref:HNH endonuclease n=1 Tax=Rhizobium sp. SG_E_25_P2 TaxID=2879942 RepID=UPI0024753A70|nr:HNH endonuclease [Rhizobium sp. SG_E_25_P2]MDH6265525.1 5-methylcytosine-specific restriction protein A [Rhizobium sp. SG_E_25_P2]
MRERDRSVKWRGWYKTERWRRLREEVLIRDGYICQQTGVICSGKYPARNSPVADHKEPHRGDEALFWDINNIQTVSKEYHDTVKQKQERAQPRGILDF